MLFSYFYLGAGSHKHRYRRRYNKLARKASKAGVDVLRSGGSALDAVKAAIIGEFLRFSEGLLSLKKFRCEKTLHGD